MDAFTTHKNWHIVVEAGALEDLASVQHDSVRQDLRDKILDKLGHDPLHAGESLQGPASHLRRLLTGYFRVVYAVDAERHHVHILAIRRCFDAIAENEEGDQPQS